MLSKLEKAKLQAELLAVSAAKAEMEFKILQREEEIEKLRQNMDNQQKRMDELQERLLAE